ncbi:hypothetical protein ACL02S_22900 [Nocardia sp. 004]|uniref:hypothetical protein n=1 Tax=Nocardia sp. 004 TaxID=3385978 RepID=UPI0039A2BE9A
MSTSLDTPTTAAENQIADRVAREIGFITHALLGLLNHLISADPDEAVNNAAAGRDALDELLITLPQLTAATHRNPTLISYLQCAAEQHIHDAITRSTTPRTYPHWPVTETGVSRFSQCG